MCDAEFEMEFQQMASVVITQDDVHSQNAEKSTKNVRAQDPLPQQPLQVSTAPRRRLQAEQVAVGITPISQNRSHPSKQTPSGRHEQTAASTLRVEETLQKH